MAPSALVSVPTRMVDLAYEPPTSRDNLFQPSLRENRPPADHEMLFALPVLIRKPSCALAFHSTCLTSTCLPYSHFGSPARAASGTAMTKSRGRLARIACSPWPKTLRYHASDGFSSAGRSAARGRAR